MPVIQKYCPLPVRGYLGGLLTQECWIIPPCCKCGGKFITHAGEPIHGYQCVMCHPPSRAVKKTAME
ncbi:FlhC family transcriptional regulator [Salmonella enterica]|uniref:FlhC family transcriptional regulator n=1 Tax=Salmonella enterica TaxID=28901 RepID=UPI0034CF30F3